VTEKGPIKLAVRPESIRFGPAMSSGMVNLSGIALRSAFVGRGVDLLFETNGSEVFSFLPGMKEVPTPGTQVTVHVPYGDLGIVLS